MHKRVNGSPRTFHLQLDPAIVEVSNPAEKRMTRCRTRRECPIPHTLHQTAHQNPRVNCCRSSRLSHSPDRDFS
jgi:hypothetical protein